MKSAPASSAPQFSAAEQQAFKHFWEVYDANYEAISQATLSAITEQSEFARIIRSMTPEQMAAQTQASRQRLKRALLDGEWEPYLTQLSTEGANYARLGVSFAGWFELLATFRRHLVPLLYRAFGQDSDAFFDVLNAQGRFIDLAMAAIGEGYLHTKEEIIRNQQEAIRELSTPVLQLRDRLLILPLIGVLESYRAQQVTEQLLLAIRERRARVVVIDITGVPTVDSMVANHLIQTVEAARLMGATAIITGLSAEIAQTLVRIGVDVTKLNTVGDLQGGIEEANRLLRYRVVRLDDEAQKTPQRQEGTG